MAYLPMGDTNTYDRFGKTYDIDRILNPDITLNHTAYEEYSAMYLSPPYISLYLLTFAISTCIISHTLLYHGRTIWNAFRNIDPEEEDIHAKLMKVYPEVPNWWYWIVIALFFVIAAISVQVGSVLLSVEADSDKATFRPSQPRCLFMHFYCRSLCPWFTCYLPASSLPLPDNR